MINCDYNQKENEILTNSLESYQVMTNHFRELLKQSISEIQKRDEVIENQALAIVKAEEIMVDLKDALQKERNRKKANKWIYFGAGLAGGIFGYKQITK